MTHRYLEETELEEVEGASQILHLDPTQVSNCLGQVGVREQMNGTPILGQSNEALALLALEADGCLKTLRVVFSEFNLFEVLGVERAELVHSRVLE